MAKPPCIYLFSLDGCKLFHIFAVISNATLSIHFYKSDTHVQEFL